MSGCKDCGRALLPDEIALYKKLFNRGATEWACLTCMAKGLDCSEELLKRKIEQFRKDGCTLFAPAARSSDTASAGGLSS